MATIYRKTAKGVLEVETRATRLAPRFRSLLILVDGRRSDEELNGLVVNASEHGLQALSEGGFIEAIGMTADVTARPAAERAAAPTAPGFEQRRQLAVRQLIDLVGPMGEAIAVKLERAASPEEFKALLETAAQILANTRGRAVAVDFYQRFSDD